MTWSPSRGPGGIAISSSRSALFESFGLGEQLLVRAQAGLALRLPRLRAHAHPLELAGQRALAGVGGLLLASHALELLLQPRRVVAAERDAAAAVELEDPLRDVVEEVPVVGDRDDGPGVLLEEALEPLDRLGVEVVGGLVEQQQVGVLEQQPGERDAALLAAGQRRDVGVVGRAAQRVHRDVDVALEAPRVRGVDLVLERGLLGADRLVVGVGLGPLGHDGVVLVDEVLDRPDAVEHVALDVLRRVERRLLAQVADREARGEPRLAAEAVVEAGHDPEQARLARAVRPDDADLGARVEGERDVLEDRAVRRVVPGELVRGVDEFGRHRRTRVTNPAPGPPWRLACPTPAPVSAPGKARRRQAPQPYVVIGRTGAGAASYWGSASRPPTSSQIFTCRLSLMNRPPMTTVISATTIG